MKEFKLESEQCWSPDLIRTIANRINELGYTMLFVHYPAVVRRDFLFMRDGNVKLVESTDMHPCDSISLGAFLSLTADDVLVPVGREAKFLQEIKRLTAKVNKLYDCALKGVTDVGLMNSQHRIKVAITQINDVMDND